MKWPPGIIPINGLTVMPLLDYLYNFNLNSLYLVVHIWTNDLLCRRDKQERMHFATNFLR